MATGPTCECLLALTLLLSAVTVDSLAITRVAVSLLQDVHIISVEYTSRVEPVTLWEASNRVVLPGAYENISSANAFFGPSGVTTLAIGTEQLSQNLRHDAALTIADEDTKVTLVLNNSALLNNEITQQDIPNLQIIVQPDHTVSFNKGDIVEMSVSVTSQALPRFQVQVEAALLQALDYFLSPPGRIVRYSHDTGYGDDDDVFIMSRELAGNASFQSTTAVVNTSFPHVEGTVTVSFALTPVQQESLVREIVIARSVYLKENTHSAPYRTNTLNFMAQESNDFRQRFLYLVSRGYPYMKVSAMGNPRPDIRLYRGCEDITGTVFERHESPSGSRFQSDTLFYLSASARPEVRDGPVMVKARSGLAELRDVGFVYFSM